MIEFFIESFVKGLGKATAAIVVCGVGTGLYYLGMTSMSNKVTETTENLNINYKKMSNDKSFQTETQMVEDKSFQTDSNQTVDEKSFQTTTDDSSFLTTEVNTNNESEYIKDSTFDETKNFGGMHNARKFGKFYFGF